MTFYVKDPATDKAVRKLAKLKGKTLTDTIREAVEKEYQSSKATQSIAEKLDALADRFSGAPRSGLQADKAFFDELSGDI
jgi:antitoxin VapB